MNHINADQCDKLKEVLLRAGGRLMEYWPGSRPGALSDIQTKADGSSVTEADFASNEIIITGLSKIFPGDAILSEEVPWDDSQNSDRLWILDPLDGTRSFIEGRDDFSILLALVVNGAVELGLMYFPAKAIFAEARKGQGAYANGQKQSVSRNAPPGVAGVYIRNFAPRDESIKADGEMDSGYAFYSVGIGAIDGAIVRLSRHKQWDLAAPSLFIEEAGGKISDEHGHPIRHEPGEIPFKYFIASNSVCHEGLLEQIGLTQSS